MLLHIVIKVRFWIQTAYGIQFYGVEEEFYFPFPWNLHRSVILGWSWQGVETMWSQPGRVCSGRWVKPCEQCGGFVTSERFSEGEGKRVFFKLGEQRSPERLSVSWHTPFLCYCSGLCLIVFTRKHPSEVLEVLCLQLCHFGLNCIYVYFPRTDIMIKC